MKSLLLFTLLFGIFFSSSLARYVIKGEAHECILSNSCQSKDWIKNSRAHFEERIELIFAIRQQNFETLEQIVKDVSTPGSPNFGNHLTLEEVGTLTTDPADTKAVQDFLVASGLKNFKTLPNGDFIRATTTIALAQSLLSTEFYHYTSETTGRNIIRTERYSLPEEIAPLVDFVGNTIQFPPTYRPVKYGFAGLPQANGEVSPSLLASYYNIESNTCQTDSSTMSVFEALAQSYSPTDLTSFQTKFSIPQQAVAKVVGPNSGNSCKSNPNNCVEAGLDVQWIIAVAQGCPLWFWSISGNGDIFLEWILAVAGTTTPPYVHSMSYGSIESEEVQSDMARFNQELAKFGARGLTVIIASGDDGVANFIARSDKSKCGFNPSFPATSPYATAVGATQGPENGQTEIMCSSKTGGLITSGGGFSSVFGQPEYQSSAVSTYFTQSVTFPPTSQYNQSGRAYPDVAVMGHNYVEADGGQFYPVSGTSASAPVFAGMIALINSYRLNSGKSAIGFLNPILYHNATAAGNVFHDITSGENNCCAGEGSQIVCCQYGFYAAPEWDPTTGYGSVNFGNLKTLLTSL